MTTKEIIEGKKAMLEAIANTVEHVQGQIEWTTSNLNDTKGYLEDHIKEFEAEHEGEEDADVTQSWRYHNYQNEIRNYTNSIRAYENLMKVLEKMI